MSVCVLKYRSQKFFNAGARDALGRFGLWATSYSLIRGAFRLDARPNNTISLGITIMNLDQQKYTLTNMSFENNKGVSALI